MWPGPVSSSSVDEWWKNCTWFSNLGGALCALWDVRHPGAKLEKLPLDHEKQATAKHKGEARQEPRHPPARCPETRQEKKGNQQHDPKPQLKIYIHSTASCRNMLHQDKSDKCQPIKCAGVKLYSGTLTENEHRLPRMTPGLPLLLYFSCTHHGTYSRVAEARQYFIAG